MELQTARKSGAKMAKLMAKMDPPISAALRRGLIEARPQREADSGERRISAALRRGLIEARANS